MFGKKPIFDDPLLGPLAWSAGHWWTSALVSSDGDVTFRIAGSLEGPTSHALERAKSTLSESGQLVAAAKAYVLIDPEASESCQGHGELLLDGFSVSDEGRLNVELALSGWPDAMITVTFSAEMIPCKASLAD